uniref:Uncharacterized protein n=1 Tax=viral metagenome TaxID=1070528 RepID=A0A6M3LBX5_9ZZZZ
MLKAIYTNKTDYSETKTWEVQVVSFLLHSPQDLSRQHGTLAQQPCGVCVFEDGHIEVVPVKRLKVVFQPAAEQTWMDTDFASAAHKHAGVQWYDPAPATATQVQDNDEPPICATVSSVEDISLTSRVPGTFNVISTREAFRKGVQWAHDNVLLMDSPTLADAVTEAAKAAYPDDRWERHTVETGRKSGTTHQDVWPAGEGWEIAVDRGRVGTPSAGWERFDNHEELYFRRRATGEA